MIYLYSKTLPNYDNNAHYIASSPADFWLSLGDDYIPITEDKFMLNGNELTVSLPDDVLTDDITYIAWNNAGNWRFYFVNTQMTQSGYSVYSLSLDLWATYINQAELSNMVVKRCNRNLDEVAGVKGLYDAIPLTNLVEYTALEDAPDYIDLSIVFTVVMSVGETSIISNKEASFTTTFACDLGYLSGAFDLDTAIRYISGIYSAKLNANIKDYKVNVLKAYLIPTEYLTYKPKISFTVNNVGYEVPIFNSIVYGAISEGTTEASFVGRELAPSVYTKYFDIETSPNYKYFIGTKLSGLEIDRATTPTQIGIRIITKQDGLNITVMQGDKMKDITDSFAINLSVNEGNVTSLEKVGEILQLTGGLASGIFQMKLGGAGYFTGALTMGNALTNAFQPNTGHYIAGGDAVNTYRDPSTGDVLCPFYQVTYKSVTDEEAHARLYGATYNHHIDTLEDLRYIPLLGTGSLTDTYVEMSLRVDKVPIEARDIIKATFENGVYLRFV